MPRVFNVSAEILPAAAVSCPPAFSRSTSTTFAEVTPAAAALAFTAPTDDFASPAKPPALALRLANGNASAAMATTSTAMKTALFMFICLSSSGALGKSFVNPKRSHALRIANLHLSVLGLENGASNLPGHNTRDRSLSQGKKQI
jgi:hypothetical protein